MDQEKIPRFSLMRVLGGLTVGLWLVLFVMFGGQSLGLVPVTLAAAFLATLLLLIAWRNSKRQRRAPIKAVSQRLVFVTGSLSLSLWASLLVNAVLASTDVITNRYLSLAVPIGIVGGTLFAGLARWALQRATPGTLSTGARVVAWTAAGISLLVPLSVACFVLLALFMLARTGFG